MSAGFPAFLTEDRRLAILRLLESQEGYRANDSVLHTALDRLGHSVSRDVVRGDLSWLEEQGLLSTELIAGTVLVATATQRGADVATGRTRHPGVKRPSPRL